MNKKFMYSFAALFAFALVSAGLVSYYSDKSTINVSVESPFMTQTVGGVFMPTSDTDAGWEDSQIALEINAIGGDTVEWTNYINKRSLLAIDVNDQEIISQESGIMEGLDEEFSFFGARYWRAEGSAGRLTEYNDDVNLGYDPYTYNNGVDAVSCHSPMDALTPTLGNDISGDSWVSIRDDICYYTDEAFDFVQNTTDGSLVSNYEYIYPADFTNELAQYKATFAYNIEAGNYQYTRQIVIPTVE